MGIIDGSSEAPSPTIEVVKEDKSKQVLPNSAYATWLAQDQQVLAYLFNWYVDSGSTNHITAELDKMTVREKYGGREQVHAANGIGMSIKNIGHSILHSPIRDLHLKNILHVPSSHKSLASVHQLTRDNNAYIEFHPNFFLIKEQATKKILHQGRCEGGLYPLVSRFEENWNKSVFA